MRKYTRHETGAENEVMRRYSEDMKLIEKIGYEGAQ